MADKLEGIELLVIAEKEVGEKYPGWRIRVVQWVKEGASIAVHLERREFYRSEDGEIMPGKAKGFTFDDLNKCKPHWAKIIDFMKNPPEVKQTEAQDAPAENGEVPF